MRSLEIFLSLFTLGFRKRNEIYCDSKGLEKNPLENMNIQFTGAVCGNSALFNSLLDGEHILRSKTGEYINTYAAFDIYIRAGKNVRTLPFTLSGKDSRLELLTTIVKELRLTAFVTGDIVPVLVTAKTFYKIINV